MMVIDSLMIILKWVCSRCSGTELNLVGSFRFVQCFNLKIFGQDKFNGS